ncbi:MAG: phosphatase PAP2 family protein [Thermoanaerobaculia bacterium]
MKRPYFFEIFVVVNLAVVVWFAHESLPLLGSPLEIIGGLVLSMAVQATLGVAVRSVVALVRRDRAYFRIIRSARWLVDTARLLVAAALVVFTYGWIKLVVPIYHPTLFDQVLWDLDQVLGFGVAPTVFFLDLLGSRAFLRTIDWLYANIFLASTVVASAYFLSEPSRRIRVAFANGYAALWITGAWLYLAVPSLGPAYAFKDIWMVHGDTLRITQTFQALLMRNYHNVLRAATGQPAGDITIVFGIGAFPSLHVAFQTYVFLWMRRLWTSGEVLFGIFAVAIFLGSMITGWHYLIDGIAGVALALVCYKASAGAARIRRWLELRRR